MEEIIGRRIFLNIKRPKKQLIDQFRGIPSSNIGDVAERLFCTNSSLRPMNKAPMAGTAFTVKCPADDVPYGHGSGTAGSYPCGRWTGIYGTCFGRGNNDEVLQGARPGRCSC